MNFELMLFLASVFTGVVWLLDSLFFARRRAASLGAENAPKLPILVEYCRSFFPVILIVFLLRGLLVEPFRIPSGSMLPTLQVGDFILVNKFSYGVRLPVTKWKILELKSPQRGDVAVFRFPLDPSVDYIKRIIGVPGDRIRYQDKQLYVNGNAVPREFSGWDENGRVALFNEYLFERKHLMQQLNDRGSQELDGEWVVPENSYFAMGDNRDASFDSRKWKFIPDENLVGKAFMIWMHLDTSDWSFNWRRIGDLIE